MPNSPVASALESTRAQLRKFFSVVGPGFITGAADDDPTGIATYSISGAQQGMDLLWLAWVTWPMMAAVQMMCARIGMVTGLNLTKALCKKFPTWIVGIACVALFLANMVNIAADLAGMADAMEMMIGHDAPIYSVIFIVGFGGLIGAAIVYFPYRRIANIMTWLAISLFAYVLTPFTLHADWHAILRDSFTFSLGDQKNWQMIVAIMGTTISPCLFFWQTAQEVEEEKQAPAEERRPRHHFLTHRALDVGFGTALSNVVMYFIILTAALTLHAHGITNVKSAKDVATALEPLAGRFAMLTYTVGIITGGVLAIPVLAGSAAYAFAGTFDWKHGLDRKRHKAQEFYNVILISVVGGILLNMFSINPMKALVGAAIVNGVLAPFLMTGVLLIARDKVIMKDKCSGLLCQVTVGITALLMYGAAFALFLL